MKKASLRTVAAAVSLAFAGAAFAQAPSAYTIVDIGAPASNTISFALDLSSNGQYIAGRGQLGTGQPNQAFVWDAVSGLTKLSAYSDGTTSYTHAFASGVNDSRVVVGMASTGVAVSTDATSYYYTTAPVPVVWKNGTVTSLVTSGQGRVFDINNGGLAVGSTGTIGSPIPALAEKAVVFNTNTLTNTTISATTDAGLSMVRATRINDSGLVVGLGSDNTSMLAFDALANTMTRMVSADGLQVMSSVYDINNSGLVVGTVGTATNPRPATWSAAAGLTVLPMPEGAAYANVAGVNDQGWLLVNVRFGGSFTPYLYVDGGMYPVSSMVADATPFTLLSGSVNPTGLGNDGTIAGSSGRLAPSPTQVHAFAMSVSAVPEPSSYALLLGGLAAIGAVARRRRPAGR